MAISSDSYLFSYCRFSKENVRIIKVFMFFPIIDNSIKNLLNKLNNVFDYLEKQQYFLVSPGLSLA